MRCLWRSDDGLNLARRFNWNILNSYNIEWKILTVSVQLLIDRYLKNSFTFNVVTLMKIRDFSCVLHNCNAVMAHTERNPLCIRTCELTLIANVHVPIIQKIVCHQIKWNHPNHSHHGYFPSIPGILIYEMLVGYPPFYDDNPFGIYEKILSCKVDWPRQMDAVAKDLLKKLLVPDRTKRLGNMKNGGEDIRRHRWFKHLDWDDVFNRKLTVSINTQKHNAQATI